MSYHSCSHAFHLHGFAFHKLFVLCIGEYHALDLLGNVHTVGTQGDNFVGLWIDGDIGRKRIAVLGRYLDCLAKVARSE